MKKVLHRANSRGFANHGWLQAAHSFSFANFYDAEKVHFGALRVLNDDLIAPKMGFGTHPHDNMEIITIPLKGVLKHRDSMHNEWQAVNAGEVQVMSAGTGVSHSEINGSQDEHLSLFQIWIIPYEKDISPRYDQKKFDVVERINKLQILVSPIDDKDTDSLKIHQNAVISRIDLDQDKTFKYGLRSKYHGVYLMNIHGKISIDNENIGSRDAIGISETSDFVIKAEESASLLLIEVPML
jgi:hypothetical protein